MFCCVCVFSSTGGIMCFVVCVCDFCSTGGIMCSVVYVSLA